MSLTIIVYVLVAVISIGLFLMTYPFFMDVLKEAQDMYKE